MSKRAKGTNPLWFKDAVIYETHIKAFADSDGDGMGDFRGMIGKLDYLQDLGVTAIWLLPFYPSPLRDDGYDIADYFNINPAYGTLKDFRDLLREAHKRGLRVITELVLNHTSDMNPWFQASRRAAPGTPEREMYVWSDTPDRYRDARIIFQDFETSNWSWDPVARGYYWHRFYSHQPDLNFENPRVHELLLEVIDFWLGMGVDGLRLDAVPYLYEEEGTNCENLPRTHEFLRKVRAHIDANFPDRMLLAEANQWPEDAVAYFGKDGDECQMCFHFPVMPRMFMALQMEDRFPIIDILDQTPAIPETCQWGMFLRNHDELTLEMVTDEERDYMYRVYATDPRARINLGIRRRLAPLLNNNRRKIELINILLFSLPGTPILYYGDEIGMGDNIFLGDRNGVRMPMQWSPDRNAGFSSANPQQLFLPVTIDPEYHYEAVNVDNQEGNVSSLLWWMRRTIAMRQRFQAFGRGSIEFLYPDNAKVLAFVRRYSDAERGVDEMILVVVNLSRYSQVAELDLAAYAGHTPVEVFSQNRFPNIKDSPYLLTLGPHGHYWFLLERQAAVEHLPQERATPEFVGRMTWKDLLGVRGRKLLEKELLPGYLANCRWFGGKARVQRSVQLRDVIPFRSDGYEAHVLLVGVDYVEGNPETYVLPIQIASGEAAHAIRQDHPQAVIAQFVHESEQTILFDALFDPQFRAALLALMTGRDVFRGRGGVLRGEASQALRDRVAGGESLSSMVMRTEQSNTSAVYGGEWFLKLYRRLDEGLNPDVELTRFLSEQAGFGNVPPFAGAISYESPREAPRMLCMAQGLVQNQGDAWSLTLDVVGQFFERVLTEKPPLPSTDLPPLNDVGAPQLLSPEFLHVVGAAYPERVRLLAQRTAEMHLALAGDRSDPAFAPDPFTLLYQRSIYQSMRNGLRRTFLLLSKRRNLLSAEAADEAGKMLAREKEILDRMARVMGRKIDVEKIRIHGDYHLGQVLDAGRDFAIIDFEGEPARPISERRLKRCALRDVAGMLRSFHYAAFTALRQQVAVRDVDIPTAVPWADLWYEYIARTFLESYLAAVGEAKFLPRDPADVGLLLDAYLLDKAVYEVAYELNNRPEWLRVPLRGIAQILDDE